MELRISASELSRAISLVQGVVQRKNTMPILSHLLLEATAGKDGGTLTLSATDLDVGVRVERACEVSVAGSVTLPARALADIARELPGPDIALKRMANNHVDVKSGRTRAKLVGLSAEEFPALPAYQNAKLSPIDATLFLDAIDKTLFAASQDETRYNLNGVLLESGNDGASTFVATDGHRLVRLERNLGESGKALTKAPVILSRKGLAELRRVFSTDAGALEIGFHENHVVLRQGSTVLGMRVVDGQFPDYRQVIPKLSDKVVRIARQDLLASLKRVSVLAQDKMQPVKLALTRDQLLITCTNPEAGEISDDVPVEYSGQAIEVAFNARYLIEALSSLDDNNVLLKLIDNLSPGLLVGVDESRHVCVVMPMRL